MDNEKMKKQATEMNAQELEQVSGGRVCTRLPWDVPSVEEVVLRDRKGNPTHYSCEGETYHYVCPNCGRLLHEGTLDRLYCDPCDESWFALTIRDSCQRYGIYSGR